MLYVHVVCAASGKRSFSATSMVSEHVEHATGSREPASALHAGKRASLQSAPTGCQCAHDATTGISRGGSNAHLVRGPDASSREKRMGGHFVSPVIRRRRIPAVVAAARIRQRMPRPITGPSAAGATTNGRWQHVKIAAKCRIMSESALMLHHGSVHLAGRPRP